MTVSSAERLNLALLDGCWRCLRPAVLQDLIPCVKQTHLQLQCLPSLWKFAQDIYRPTSVGDWNTCGGTIIISCHQYKCKAS